MSGMDNNEEAGNHPLRNRKRRRMMSAFLVIAYGLGIISAIDAVMKGRTSESTIAWAVSLTTFPFIAVPAYWVLGRDRFNGYVVARRSLDLQADSVGRRAAESLEPFMSDPGQIPPAARAAERLASIPVLSGNSVELLIDGDDTFESILNGIDAAEDYVLFQFFIVKDDGLGRRVKDKLIEKARQGVRVLFLYDEVGSYKLPRSYRDELRQAGAEVYDFHTRQGPWNRFQINFRNHRKIVVVDGRVSWIGGHNVGDEYLGLDPEFGRWRDTHARIEGPGALAAQLSFAEDWNWATGGIPANLSWEAVQAADGRDAPVLIIPTGPADELETAQLMFIHAINSATERIWIASPYFVPDKGVMAALHLANLRGVDVRLLIPDKADHLLVWLAAFSYFEEALGSGTRIFKYMDGFLHEKAILVDNSTAAIGTANFDNRSFRLNFEVTAFVGDSTFVEEVAEMFEEDFRNSREVKVEEYSEKPFWFKLAVRLARLTAPVQ